MNRFAVLLALLVAAATGARAQTHAITFHVVSARDDDVTDPPTDAIRSCSGACLRAHYVVRLVNCQSALDDGTCVTPNARAVTGGVLTDTLPPSLPLDCALGIAVAGSGSSDPPTCDALTNTVRITGVSLPPGGDLVVSFWTGISCDTGTPWNRPAFDYDQNPGPAPIRAIDPQVFNREGLVFSVGTLSVASPLKDAPGLPFYRDSRLGENGLRQPWEITIDNPDCSPLSFAGIWDTISPADCLEVDCSTLRIWINDHPRPLPPGWRCPSGTDEWAIGALELAPHDSLRITFDSIISPDEAVTECCNQAWFATADGRTVTSVDPFLDTRLNPEPTCINLALASASRFDALKIAEDAAGNPIETVTPGSDIYWRIQIVNSGNFPISPSLDDEFVPGLLLDATSIVEPFPVATCTIAGQHLSCTGIDIPAFTTVEMRVRTGVDCAVVQGGMAACNEATSNVPGFGTFPTHCPGCVKSSPANRTCVTMLAPNFEHAEKTVTDANGDGFVQIGERLTYRIEPLNSGTADGTLLVVADAAPVGTLLVAGSLALDGVPLSDAADADAGEISGSSITVRIGRAVPWAFGMGLVTFDVIAEAPVPPQLCNADATLQWAEAVPCGLAAQVIPPACLPVDAPVIPPSLALAKRVSPSGSVEPGATLGYELTACNDAVAGGATAGVVTDLVPAGTTFVSGSLALDAIALTDAADADAGELVVGPPATVAARLGDLAPGACRVVTFAVTVDAATTADVVNEGRLSAADAPETPSNRTTTPIVIAPDPPRLALSKTSRVTGGAPLRAGGEIAYELQACNDAAAGPAETLVITDAVPFDAASGCGAAYVAGSLLIDGVAATDAADGDAGELVAAPAPGSIVVRLSSLAPGECVTVELRVTAEAGCDDGEVIENEGKASATGVAPVVSPRTSDVVREDAPAEPSLLRKVGGPLADRCPDFPVLCGCAVGLRLDPVADDCVVAGTCSRLDPTTWLVPGELQRRSALVFYEIAGAGCQAAGDPTRLAVSKSSPDDVRVSLVP
jgi:uncharacterized repeat protein (TIGR01451 family)